MSRVADWLLALYPPTMKFWVNAKDEDGDDFITWRDGSNLQVLSFLWLPGTEDNHGNGDCVCLNLESDPGLVIWDCYEDNFYALCKI